MSSVKVIKASFRRSGSTITGDVSFEVSFNDSEIRANVGFIPTVVVAASKESTDTTVVSADARTGSTTYLSVDRKEVGVQGSTVLYPRGNASAVTSCSISVDVASLLPRFAYAWDKATNQGLDVVRVEVRPEIASSSSATLASQRFGA